MANSDPTYLASCLDAFRQGLRELGYREGQNIAIEYRYAAGKYERLPDFATELVRLKVDVIVTESSIATQAGRSATTTIPNVMALVGDPVGAVLIRSLTRPGANITGVTSLSLDLVGKQMEMLKEMVPGLDRVAVVWNPGHMGHPRTTPGARAAARTLGLELQLTEVRSLYDLGQAFAELTRKRPGALIAMSDPLYDAHQKWIADFAMQNRLPTAYTKAFAEYGGLISYGARFPDLYKNAAVYVGKILKGAKPADLPVEQPTRFELVVNRKTANALGLAIPLTILLRADRVIE